MELTETEAKLTVESDQVELKGIELENVFGSAVLTVRKPIYLTTSRGLLVEVPAQRLAPFRQGQSPSHEVRLNILFGLPNANQHGFGDGVALRELSSPLGSFGIRSLTLSTSTFDLHLDRQAQSLSRRDKPGDGKKFISSERQEHSFAAGKTLRPGTLPPIKLDLNIVRWKVIAEYKGIISVPSWP